MSIRIEHLPGINFSDEIDPTAAPVPPTYPGDILLADFMKPHGLNANQLALALRVPANRITGIAKGERAITADTAMRLSRYFGTSPEFWLNLQAHHDLEQPVVSPSTDYQTPGRGDRKHGQ